MTTTTDATAAASSEAQLLKTVTTILTSHPDPHSALKLLIQNLTLPTVLSVLSTTQLHRTHSATLLSFFHIFRHSLHPSLSSSPEPLLALLPGLLVHRRYSSARSLLLNFISSDHPRHSLHQLLFRRPRLPQPLLDTSLSAYALSDHPDLAFQLFNKMKRLRIKPNLLTCHSLLSSLVRRHPHSSHSIHLSKQGQLSKVREVLLEMKGSGVSPNRNTYNILVHGYCKLRWSKEAAEVVELMRANDMVPNIWTYNTIMRGLCDEGKVKEAISLRDDIESLRVMPDEWYCKEGKMDEASCVVAKMVESGFSPDCFTYNTMINGYCKAGNPGEAFKIMDEMGRKGLKMDTFTLNTIVHKLCMEKLLKEAYELTVKTTKRGYILDEVTYGTLIMGYFKNDQSNKALKLWDEMKEKGIIPSVVTYNTIIGGLCHSLKTDQAVDKLNELLDKGLAPDEATCNIIIHGFCREGALEKAFLFYNRMVENSFKPDVIT
nr:pentatricopeptide repeat-containing protein At2g16880-like [Arachis hypogaea]